MKCTCPNCQREFEVGFVAKLRDEARFQFVLRASPGEMMSAETVGGSLKNVAAVFKTANESLGAETEILLEKIETEGGVITAHLLVVRFDQATARRLRMKQARKAAKAKAA